MLSDKIELLYFIHRIYNVCGDVLYSLCVCMAWNWRINSVRFKS